MLALCASQLSGAEAQTSGKGLENIYELGISQTGFAAPVWAVQSMRLVGFASVPDNHRVTWGCPTQEALPRTVNKGSSWLQLSLPFSSRSTRALSDRATVDITLVWERAIRKTAAKQEEESQPRKESHQMSRLRSHWREPSMWTSGSNSSSISFKDFISAIPGAQHTSSTVTVWTELWAQAQT